jgi:hypothetical protein
MLARGAREKWFIFPILTQNTPKSVKGLIREERGDIIGALDAWDIRTHNRARGRERRLPFPQRPGDIARSLNMSRRTLYRGSLAYDFTT